ncbi:PhzF family phenazine biosynthesis protein [Veronia pacifica]|uniref:PhzF family phenazine biosynthesis protein n=1 Tax=Veronia pacifica TaxID=1080227 RepID=UPI001FDFF57F|nr:PhzF family phenazine biosynthesis protein [Veronia pacifica]
MSKKQAQGNPAAVVLMHNWPDDNEMLTFASEREQPVTAFVVKESKSYAIRWFSQSAEINLCGHGTLAAAAAITDRDGIEAMSFTSRYGDIDVTRIGEQYRIQFPIFSRDGDKATIDVGCLPIQPVEAFFTRDIVLVLASESEVMQFELDKSWLKQQCEHHALIVTAQSADDEYVLRYFAPSIGIDEDIATGSAQCSLAPYWFEKTGRRSLAVRQLSESGGQFNVHHHSDSQIFLDASVHQCHVE